MKKTVLSLILITALSSAIMSGTIIVQVAYAPSEGVPYKPPAVTVLSPSPNGIYNMPDVPLNVTVQIFGYTNLPSFEVLNSLNYSLDGQADTPVALVHPLDYNMGYYVNGSGILSGLSDGIHNLTIVGETTIGADNKYFNTTVSFTVDTSTTSISQPFPTTFVAAACGVSVAIIGIGLFLYFNKRGRGRKS